MSYRLEFTRTAIKGLAPYHQPAVREALLRFLNSDSHHNRLRDRDLFNLS